MADSKPTRSQLLGHLVQQAVLDSRIKWGEYAAAVVEHYHAHVDVVDRVVSFHVVTSPENFDELTRLNTQTVRRLLIGEIRMPVDLEESLVAAFPQQAIRDRIHTRLLERQGLLLAHQPNTDTLSGALASPVELMRKAATAIECVAPMLDDGQIDAKDAAHFRAALDALYSVNGCVASVIFQISKAMGAPESARIN